MQPDPGLPRNAPSGVLSCVHQSVHVLYVEDGGQVSVVLSAVHLCLQPGQGGPDEVVLRRKAVGQQTEPCGWRTQLKSLIVFASGFYLAALGHE